jgi:hypothetical protein
MAVTLDGEEFELADFRGLGHTEILPASTVGGGAPAEPRFPDRTFRRVNNVLSDIETATAAAALSESNAADSETNAAASAAAAIAAAAAASKGVPVATTTGTGSAYAANFTPDVTESDAVVFSLNIHTANTTTTPTLAVEGGTARTMVWGYDRRPIPIGLMGTNINVLVLYDGTNNEYAVVGGLPLTEFNRDIDARGYDIENIKGYNRVAEIQGALSNGVVTKKIWFSTATRLFTINPYTATGTIDVVFSKNGSDDIQFEASNTVSVTSTPTESDVNEDSLAYLDFAVGDYLQLTLSNNSAAEDLIIPMLTQEKYSA